MGENNTIQSVSLAFVRTLQDFSQYISHQKALGNTMNLSRESLSAMDAWKTLEKMGQRFFCQGPENAPAFFVDSDGTFFKGESGALFVKILNAMGMTPESIFICNAPNTGSLHNQVLKSNPKIIITLGERAGQVLLNLGVPLEQFQGKFHSHKGVQVMPTFHPSALLQQPDLKRKVWEDMQQVMQLLETSP